MAEVLSQSQIDDLLNNLNSGEIDIQEIESHSKEKKVKEYDFRSPKKITKETVNLLTGIYESYCRNISSSLTSMLRFMCDVTVEQIEESIFHEYNNALDDYVLMGLINVNYPDETVSDNQILIEVSKSLSFVIIDRLLGGSGEESNFARDYTDIELSLLGNLFKQIIPPMGNSWEGTIGMKTELSKIETNSRFIQSVNYNDTVLIIVLNATLSQATGKITICIPTNILDEIFKKAEAFSKSNIKKKNSDQNFENQKEAIMKTLKVSKLTVSGVLGKTEATLGDILNMQVDDVIMLDKNYNSDIDVNVDGEKWFEGKWGAKKNKGVIKISKIIH